MGCRSVVGGLHLQHRAQLRRRLPALHPHSGLRKPRLWLCSHEPDYHRDADGDQQADHDRHHNQGSDYDSQAKHDYDHDEERSANWRQLCSKMGSVWRQGLDWRYVLCERVDLQGQQ